MITTEATGEDPARTATPDLSGSFKKTALIAANPRKILSH
jgi:hypothetical protein